MAGGGKTLHFCESDPEAQPMGNEWPRKKKGEGASDPAGFILFILLLLLFKRSQTPWRRVTQNKIKLKLLSFQVKLPSAPAAPPREEVGGRPESSFGGCKLLGSPPLSHCARPPLFSPPLLCARVLSSSPSPAAAAAASPPHASLPSSFLLAAFASRCVFPPRSVSRSHPAGCCCCCCWSWFLELLEGREGEREEELSGLPPSLSRALALFPGASRSSSSSSSRLGRAASPPLPAPKCRQRRERCKGCLRPAWVEGWPPSRASTPREGRRVEQATQGQPSQPASGRAGKAELHTHHAEGNAPAPSGEGSFRLLRTVPTVGAPFPGQDSHPLPHIQRRATTGSCFSPRPGASPPRQGPVPPLAGKFEGCVQDSAKESKEEWISSLGRSDQKEIRQQVQERPLPETLESSCQGVR
uniref:uncharacterized protein LOC114604458 n=1 Tax=Podarcis muralis TaxID=64176 RepID=UPI0010A03543|nr:uncharacterized protein LOC114604458 [Podarcis muralis]